MDSKPKGAPKHPVSKTVPLTRLKADRQARIVEIRRDPEGHWRKLIALGLTPDSILYLVQRYPSYVVQVGHTMIALDRQMAELLLVKDEGA